MTKKKERYKPNGDYIIVAKFEDGTEERYAVKGRDIEQTIEEKLKLAKLYWIEPSSIS